MNTQQTEKEIKKKGVQVNPSRDKEYEDEIDAAGQEVNPGEIDKTEVDLDRGGKEFSGGEVNKQGSPSAPTPDIGGDASEISQAKH